MSTNENTLSKKFLRKAVINVILNPYEEYMGRSLRIFGGGVVQFYRSFQLRNIIKSSFFNIDSKDIFKHPDYLKLEQFEETMEQKFLEMSTYLQRVMVLVGKSHPVETFIPDNVLAQLSPDLISYANSQHNPYFGIPIPQDYIDQHRQLLSRYLLEGMLLENSNLFE